MERTITVSISGSTMRKSGKNAGVKGEANATTLHLAFGQEWNGYAKRIIWHDAAGENPVPVMLFDRPTINDPLEYDTPIPKEAMAVEGECCFTVEGFRTGNPNAVAYTATGRLTVAQNDSAGLNSAGPTPTEAQQLQQAINTLAQEAVFTVNGVRPDAKGNVNTPGAGAGTGGGVVSVNGKNGIVKLSMEDVAYSGAAAHNAIYRGKYLGDAFTATQRISIRDGSFTDLFIGDYWTIEGINYRIAAFDYYLGTGDEECIDHHVVIVPDTNLYTHVMNDTNITTGGYIGSKMYTEGLAQAKTKINSAFGSSHILSHRQLLVNAVTNGKPSGGSWYDSTVELMTEQNVYGGKIFGTGNDGSTVPYLYTIDKSQFPLFAHDPSMISNRQWFWLRDVVSAASFAYVGGDGLAASNLASGGGGVRPYFCIYGG